MTFIDVLLGKEPSLNEAEEALGKPDHMEAEHLPYHVEKCATRWVLSYRMSRANNAQIAQIRLWIIIGVAIEAGREAGLFEIVKAALHLS